MGSMVAFHWIVKDGGTHGNLASCLTLAVYTRNGLVAWVTEWSRGYMRHCQCKDVFMISNLGSPIWLIERIENGSQAFLDCWDSGIASLVLPPLVRLDRCF